MPNSPLHLLVVEDSESDFELLSLRLAGRAFAADLSRVETEEEMRAALRVRLPDLVISDHSLPRFSVGGALRVLREHDPDTPLIVVSGAIGEEAAVDSMIAGAEDFIVKGNLSRLVPAIVRSIGAATARRRQREAEATLRERDAMLGSLAANLPAMMFRLDYDRVMRRFNLPYAGEGSTRMFGLDPASLRADPVALLRLIDADDRALFFDCLAKAAESGAELTWQGKISVAGGRWVQLSAKLREPELADRGSSSTHAVWDGILYDITDLKHAEAEIRGLTAHLQEAKEKERAEVAREIHDEIGALFFAVKVDLAWVKKRVSPEPTILERLDSIGSLIDSGVQASQRIVRALRPAVLDFGVVGAAEWLASDFSKRTGIACTFTSEGGEPSLRPELGTAVFRVMQESLTNVSRHSGASAVAVRFDLGREAMSLEVLDNGRGIGPDDLAKSASFGVRGMRERALELGGALEIGPAPQGGTRLALRLPIRPAVDAARARA